MHINDVVQFNENHKWVASLGIITEIKEINGGKDIRYMVGVPCPQQGIAYIFVLESENAIEYIGEAKIIPYKENKI